LNYKYKTPIPYIQIYYKKLLGFLKRKTPVETGVQRFSQEKNQQNLKDF